MPNDDLLRAALGYAARGWSVLPCEPRGKRPLTAHGVNDATTDAATIRGWWTRWPSANIGIACGAASGGLLVLDIDEVAGAAAALRDRPMPPTPQAVTAKGRHHYFHAAGPVRNAVRVVAGCDVRGDGGYVVAPPSVHPSGRVYEWAPMCSPDDAPLADAPDWLAALVRGPGTPATGPATDAGPIPAGRRNDTLARVAGSLRARGCDADTIRAALAAVNAARCDPPLPDREVDRIARSVARYPPGPDPAPAPALHPEALVALAREIADGADGDLSTRVRREVVPALAGLDPLARDRVVREVARALGVATATLRREVEAVRPSEAATASEAPSILPPPPEPWPEPVTLAEVLDEIAAYLRRYLVLPDHAPEALALMVVMTWTRGPDGRPLFERLPLGLITSPAPRSGKSTLVDLLARVVCRPLSIVSVSAAALYRIVEIAHPTILLDEADALLADNPDLTALVNAAHARESARVIRCHPETLVPEVFEVFTPIVIAGNNPRMAPATRDRCITVRMVRKARHEVCERARARAVQAVAGPIARKLARLALDLPSLVTAAPVPEVPEALNDRAADAWEPLLTLADLAGGEWPARARAAAVALSGTADEDVETLGVRLLGALRDLFERERVDRLPSERICEALIGDPEAPWGDLGHGERLTPRRLARMLAPFGVGPARTRDWRGYYRDAFGEAWARYLPPPSPQSVTSVTAASNGRETHFSQVSQTPLCDTSQIINKPAWNKARDACDALEHPRGGIVGDEVTDRDPDEVSEPDTPPIRWRL